MIKNKGGTFIEEKWQMKECDGCKLFNPECRQGMCCLHPYKRMQTVSSGEKLDTS